MCVDVNTRKTTSNLQGVLK